MLPTRIILGSDDLVTVRLRDAQGDATGRSVLILDVNETGRWLHGIELLGSFADFNLEKAMKPFNPRRPLSGESNGVTYDEDANAAFIYFSMKSPDTSLPETAFKYSHSITPEAEIALDCEGGLVWLRFSSQDANVSPAEFISLINAPVEHHQ